MPAIMKSARAQASYQGLIRDLAEDLPDGMATLSRAPIFEGRPRPAGHRGCHAEHGGSLHGVFAERRAVSWASSVPSSPWFSLPWHPAAHASGDRVKVNHGWLLRQLDRPQDGAVILGAQVGVQIGLRFPLFNQRDGF